jgi:hypothetical protein
MRGKIELKRESLELAEVVSRAVETAQPLINAQEHHLGVRVPAESLRIDVCRVPRNVAKLQRQSSSFRRSAFSKKCLFDEVPFCETLDQNDSAFSSSASLIAYPKSLRKTSTWQKGPL